MSPEQRIAYASSRGWDNWGPDTIEGRTYFFFINFSGINVQVTDENNEFVYEFCIKDGEFSHVTQHPIPICIMTRMFDIYRQEF